MAIEIYAQNEQVPVVVTSGSVEIKETITVDSALSTTSENPVQNKVVTEKFNELSGEKVDKVDGKGLSTNDFTNEEKQKLATLEQPQVTVEAPIFVDSVEKMTDQTRLYVLNEDGFIYQYGEYKEVTEQEELFNINEVVLNKRHSGTPPEEVTANGYYITNNIPVTLEPDNILKLKLELIGSINSLLKIAYFDKSGNAISSYYFTTTAETTKNKMEQIDNTNYLIHVGYLGGGKADFYDNIASVKLNIHQTSSGAISEASEISIKIDGAGGTVTKIGWYSTGKAYTPADYEDRIIDLETTKYNHESRIVALENGSGGGSVGGSIPTFWQSAVDECITKIKALQVGINCVTFPFFSDNHTRLGYAGVLISKVMEECYIPYCFFGGDSIDSGYIASESIMIAQDKNFDEMMKVIPNGRFCRTVGNHDGFWKVSASESHSYTREQIYELFLREEAISQLKHFGEDGTYYYIDDVASKTRFIVLNSNGSFGETQMDWVQNTALQFNESGWCVVFISHQPVTNNFHANISDAQAMQTLLTNYINGSSENKADVVGWYSGHIHRDRIYQCDATSNKEADDQTTVNLPWKTVTITSDHTSIAYDDTTKHTVAEDNLSHAIDFVTINKNTKTVNITRLGIGSDRSYTYAS